MKKLQWVVGLGVLLGIVGCGSDHDHRRHDHRDHHDHADYHPYPAYRGPMPYGEQPMPQPYPDHYGPRP